MGVFSKIAKSGMAKKAYDEARKPHNQRKIKDMVAKARGGRGAGPQQPPRQPPPR